MGLPKVFWLNNSCKWLGAAGFRSFRLRVVYAELENLAYANPQIAQR